MMGRRSIAIGLVAAFVLLCTIIIVPGRQPPPPRLCPTTALPPPTTRHRGNGVLVGVALFGGHELAQIDGLTVEQCKDACQSRPGCAGMSLSYGSSPSTYGDDAEIEDATGYCWLKGHKRGWKQVADYGTVSWDGEAAAPSGAQLVVVIPSFPRKLDTHMGQSTRLTARISEVGMLAARTNATARILVGTEQNIVVPRGKIFPPVLAVQVPTVVAQSSVEHGAQHGRHFGLLMDRAAKMRPDYVMWLEDDVHLLPSAFLPTSATPTVWSLAHRSGYTFNGVNSYAILFPIAVYNNMAPCLKRAKSAADWKVGKCCKESPGLRCVGHGAYARHLPGASTNVWRKSA